MNKGLLSVDEALATLLAGARPVAEVEQVPTMAAVGRVLAQAQTSTMDVPPMDNSAMDGYAVRLSDLDSPEKKLKVAQRIPAGSVGKPLEPGTAARIFTGAPVPPGADAIAMQEHCLRECAHFDAVGTGEGERTVPEMLGRLETGQDLAGVLGVAFRQGAGIVKNPPPDHVAASVFFSACLGYESGKFGEALGKLQEFAGKGHQRNLHIGALKVDDDPLLMDGQFLLEGLWG